MSRKWGGGGRDRIPAFRRPHKSPVRWWCRPPWGSRLAQWVIACKTLPSLIKFRGLPARRPVYRSFRRRRVARGLFIVTLLVVTVTVKLQRCQKRSATARPGLRWSGNLLLVGTSERLGLRKPIQIIVLSFFSV